MESIQTNTLHVKDFLYLNTFLIYLYALLTTFHHLREQSRSIKCCTYNSKRNLIIISTWLQLEIIICSYHLKQFVSSIFYFQFYNHNYIWKLMESRSGLSLILLRFIEIFETITFISLFWHPQMYYGNSIRNLLLHFWDFWRVWTAFLCI